MAVGLVALEALGRLLAEVPLGLMDVVAGSAGHLGALLEATRLGQEPDLIAVDVGTGG